MKNHTRRAIETTIFPLGVLFAGAALVHCAFGDIEMNFSRNLVFGLFGAFAMYWALNASEALFGDTAHVLRGGTLDD